MPPHLASCSGVTDSSILVGQRVPTFNAGTTGADAAEKRAAPENQHPAPAVLRIWSTNTRCPCLAREKALPFEPERANNMPFANPLPGVPSIESPFFHKIFADVDPETRRIASELNARGYAVIDFPDPDFSDVAESIKRDLKDRYDWSYWLASGYDAAIGLRVQDAWKFDSNVKRLANNKKVIDLLTTLYGKQACPFQTLNFPVGTQQHYHTDSIHFSAVPERFMCGVWTALEDITEDCGPLVYYPGSHKWPVFTNEHIGRCVAQLDRKPTQEMYEVLWRELVESSGIKPEIFTAKKGQSLIWAANLLHGGSKQANKHGTRWSQVTHYFFEDCAYYTPMNSDPFYGKIDFRTPLNVASGEKMQPMYAGHEIPQEFIKATKPAAKFIPADFDAALYLQANPDVAASGLAAVEHYQTYGRNEGRKIRPS
jgi:ectoine hydroxylase-related dioxygenase (phytanoyl-CoA dioxygenase family)